MLSKPDLFRALELDPLIIPVECEHATQPPKDELIKVSYINQIWRLKKDPNIQNLMGLLWKKWFSSWFNLLLSLRLLDGHWISFGSASWFGWWIWVGSGGQWPTAHCGRSLGRKWIRSRNRAFSMTKSTMITVVGNFWFENCLVQSSNICLY